MKNKIIVLIICALSNVSLGQSIRKNFNEMTPSERTAYRNALANIQTVMQKLGCLHSYHFNGDNNVHGGEYFLPWHRWFQYEFERQLRNAGTANAQNLSVPYWDWRVSYSSADAWTHSNFLGNFNTNWNLERGQTGALSVLHTSSSIASILAITSFQSFTSNMEGMHGAAHGYVGGVMGGGYSPYDPVFFTHHGMIDKLWQEWEDNRVSSSTPKTVYSSGTSTNIPHNHASSNTCIEGVDWSPFTVTNDIQTAHFNINHVTDARRQDYNADGTPDNETCYAYNRKLLLNGISGTFTSTGVKNYCYVAWDPASSVTRGVVHVGNVRRDANDNVIASTLGGFKIGDAARVEIHSVNSITFHPGFTTGNNAVLTASLVQNPCGFSSSFRTDAGEEMSHEDLNSELDEMQVYPNPNTTGVLNLTKAAANFSMVNASGVEVLEGSNTQEIQVENLAKGLYLLHVDGKAIKVVIE